MSPPYVCESNDYFKVDDMGVSVDGAVVGEALAQLGMQDLSSHIGGVTITNTEEDGQPGLYVRSENGSIDEFIPDSAMPLISGSEGAPNPWWTKGKCHLIHLSLLMATASWQAMTSYDHYQAVGPMIVDISEWGVTTEGDIRLGKFVPTTFLAAEAISYYLFCRGTNFQPKGGDDIIREDDGVEEAPVPEPQAEPQAEFKALPPAEEVGLLTSIMAVLTFLLTRGAGAGSLTPATNSVIIINGREYYYQDIGS